MTDIAYFLDPVRDRVRYTSFTRSDVGTIKQIKFIKHFDPQIKNVIYVGESRQIADKLEKVAYRTESPTFIAVDTAVNLSSFALAHGLNVAAVDEDMIDLHEVFNECLRTYDQWHIALLEVANETQSIQEIVRAGSKLTASSCFLLNNSHQVVYSTSTDAELTELLSIELNTTGRLSRKSIESIDAAYAADSGPYGKRLDDDGNFEFFLYDISRDGGLFYSLLLIHPRRNPRLDAPTFLHIMAKTIDGMTTSQHSQYWAGEDFKSLLGDIVNCQITTEDKINRRLSMLSVVPQKFVSFLIIEFETADDFPDPAAYFITEVEGLFPNSNACVYNNSIVLMFGKPGRTSPRQGSFDTERFRRLLTQYHAFAAMGTPTSRRVNFRMAYLLARRVMSLAKRLRRTNNDRVFFFEDYADYLIIDLSYPSFVTAFGRDDTVYLTQPDVIQLFRYDTKYHDNLLDVLYYYCLNDLSIVKTAKALYMHRNTVAAKLKKISTLIFEDIHDGEVQQRIIISYKILRYMNLYAQIDLAKRIPAADYV